MGRTARFNKGGSGMLMLLPSEVKMIELLEKKVPIKQISVNPNKLLDTKTKLESILSEFNDIKLMAQKTVISYLRSIHLSKNKEIFDVHKLDYESFGKSLGLVNPPVVQFKKDKTDNPKKDKKNYALREKLRLIEEHEEKLRKHHQEQQQRGGDDEKEVLVPYKRNEEDEKIGKQNILRILKRKNVPEKNIQFEDEQDDEDHVFQVKRLDHELEDKFQKVDVSLYSNPFFDHEYKVKDLGTEKEDFLLSEKQTMKEQDNEDFQVAKLKRREARILKKQRMKQNDPKNKKKLTQLASYDEGMQYEDDYEGDEEDLGSVSLDEGMEDLPPEELQKALLKKLEQKNKSKKNNKKNKFAEEIEEEEEGEEASGLGDDYDEENDDSNQDDVSLEHPGKDGSDESEDDKFKNFKDYEDYLEYKKKNQISSDSHQINQDDEDDESDQSIQDGDDSSEEIRHSSSPHKQSFDRKRKNENSSSTKKSSLRSKIQKISPSSSGKSISKRNDEKKILDDISHSKVPLSLDEQEKLVLNLISKRN